MYEFAIAFTWGILVMGALFQLRYRAPLVRAISMIIAIVLLAFAVSLSSKPISLVPALQQSYLLTAHVASAVIAYGTFTTGFAAAVLFLLQNRIRIPGIPQKEKLDEMSYLSVAVGFPFLTLLIIL